MRALIDKEGVERRSRVAGHAKDISECLAALGRAKTEQDHAQMSARCGELSGYISSLVASMKDVVPPKDLEYFVETLVSAHIGRALLGLQHEESIATIFDASGRFAALSSALRAT